MNNELSERLATLARDLQGEKHVVDTADRITAEVVAWTGPDSAAGISIVRRHRKVETLAATSEVVTLGDKLQYELAEGPCLDAIWSQRQVYSDDLVADHRWPTWGPRVAEELGVRSMFASQLFTKDDTLGALNVYSPHRDGFDEQTRDELVVLAAHAAIAVADADEIEGLIGAIDRRTTIGAATGMIMERFSVNQAQAFNVLRRLSSVSNRKIYDICEEIVHTRELPG